MFNIYTNTQGVKTPRRYFQGLHKFRVRSLSGVCTYSPCIPRKPVKPVSEGSSMGLSDDPNSRIVTSTPSVSPSVKSNRAARGTHGLTKLNKELIEDGAIALWKYANGEGRSLSHQAVFLTLTIPTRFQDGQPLEQHHINYLLTRWPDLTKRLFEEIARLQVRLGIPARFLYVVEPQEERWAKEGKFYPHLHIILINQWDREKPSAKGFKMGAYSISPRDTDRIYGRLLTNLLGRAVDVSAAGRLEAIKGIKGLSSYISKLGRVASYCSKGSKLILQIRNAGYELPRSWAGADEHTRREVKGSTLTMTATLTIPEMRARLQEFSDDHQKQEGYPLFVGFWEVEVDGVDYPVALRYRIYRWDDIPLGMAVFEYLSE